MAFSPATKREFFQAPKYSDIVGVITTSEVSASLSVGSHSRAAASSSLAYFSKSRAEGHVEVGVGHRLAELDLAVVVEVGLHALGLELLLGAERAGLDQEVEVARLLERPPDGVFTSNGTALSGSLASLPASMITSYSASEGTPATTPSISS